MNTNPCTLTTGEVRFSYLHVFQPYAQQQGAEPKYSATLLIPKTDVATKGLIDAAINAATNNGVGSKWNGIRPPQLRISVHDGDGGRPSDGMPFGDECKGHWVVTASNKNAPFVVDANVQPILQQNEVYSGMYGRASITLFPYSSNGRKGVGCALNGIQKLRDGEALSGRVSAEDAFGTPAPGTPAYGAVPPQAPVYAQQPQAPAYPAYAQQPAAVPAGYPQQPAGPQIDPITGLPV